MTSMANDKFWNLLAKKLSGEANTIELQELQELMKDPDLKALSEKLSSIWNQPVPTNNSAALQALERHFQRMKGKKIEIEDLHKNEKFRETERNKNSVLRMKWVMPIIGIAATFLILFIFKYFNNPTHDKKVTHPLSQVTTKPGSRTQLRLPDGTSVWLNASSNLTYDENFGKDLREVNLIGEAFFDVIKDPSHPFIIHTKSINIRVVGTEFNVKAYPEDTYTETSLIRGSVEVTIKNRPDEKHFLKPNEKMIVANNLLPVNTPIKKEKENTPLITVRALTYDTVSSAIVETSWIDNQLIFHQNETFSEMAPKLERWYGVHFVFENKKAADEYKPFVSFTNESITQALDDLKLAYKFNYKINGNEITITQ